MKKPWKRGSGKWPDHNIQNQNLSEYTLPISPPAPLSLILEKPQIHNTRDHLKLEYPDLDLKYLKMHV